MSKRPSPPLPEVPGLVLEKEIGRGGMGVEITIGHEAINASDFPNYNW